MISFIIPWNESSDSYRSQSFSLVKDYISSVPDSELVVGYDTDNPMNRSKARNNAFLQAKGDFLVILDADTYVSIDSIYDAIDIVRSKNTWVVPYRDYYNLTQEFTDKIFNNFFDKKDLSLLEKEEFIEYEFKILSWAGALVLTRDMYSDAGFYDERFKGWGWEDVAFRLKLDNTVGKHIRCGSYISHLWHPRGDANFNTEHELRNRDLFNKDYALRYGWTDERI
jgi:predicted glycosyltransferase involved in capsule biosynthesis